VPMQAFARVGVVDRQTNRWSVAEVGVFIVEHHGREAMGSLPNAPTLGTDDAVYAESSPRSLAIAPASSRRLSSYLRSVSSLACRLNRFTFLTSPLARSSARVIP
jgi:hypothetical protein